MRQLTILSQASHQLESVQGRGPILSQVDKSKPIPTPNLRLRWSLTADRKACQPEQGCFVPFVAVPHRLIKWPAWSGTPQT